MYYVEDNHISIFIDNKKEKTWGEIFLDFFDYAKDRLQVEAIRRRNAAIRKITAFVFFLVGSIYFLNGLSGALGKLFGSNGWLGNLIVGFLLGIIGLILAKK